MMKENGIPMATINAMRRFIRTNMDKKTKTRPNIRFETTVFKRSFIGFELSA